MVEIGEIKILKDEDDRIYCQCKVERYDKPFEIGPYDTDTEINFIIHGLNVQVLINKEDDNAKN